MKFGALVGRVAIALLVGVATLAAAELRVMTSGAFTAAHLVLVPEFEHSGVHRVFTDAITMGVRATCIPTRLKKGERADVVIITGAALDILVKDGAVVARGEAEIGFQQKSELLPILGIDYVGPLPAAVQRVTVFSAGVGVNAAHPQAARAYIKFLASPANRLAIDHSGMEPMPP